MLNTPFYFLPSAGLYNAEKKGCQQSVGQPSILDSQGRLYKLGSLKAI